MPSAVTPAATATPGKSGRLWPEGGEADFIDGTLQKPSGYRGYDTFGPFKLAGGIAKDRPDARDLEIAPTFFREMQSRLK